MTKNELNRDIKRLKSEIYRMSFESLETYYKYIDTEARKEFKRLYYADQSFEYMNKNSVLIMFRLNLKHRFLPLHSFGLGIELNNL
jgi:hypothetical protein